MLQDSFNFCTYNMNKNELHVQICDAEGRTHKLILCHMLSFVISFIKWIYAPTGLLGCSFLQLGKCPHYTLN